MLLCQFVLKISLVLVNLLIQKVVKIFFRGLEFKIVL